MLRNEVADNVPEYSGEFFCCCSLNKVILFSDSWSLYFFVVLFVLSPVDDHALSLTS